MIAGFNDTVTCLVMNEKNWRLLHNNLCKEQKEYDRNAKKDRLFAIQDILNDLGIQFWLSNGTALGMIREGNFIQWDDDIDLDLYAEEYVPAYNEILNRLIDNGFVVRTCIRGETSKMSVYKTDGENIKIALGAVYLEGDYRKKLRRTYPKSFYENFIWYEYYGRKFKIPGPPEEYLAYIYKDWKTPLKTDYVQDSLLRNEIPRCGSK